ncbi:uncharacterized protein LOC129607158 [Condylostylus longicornis]|uniref:uncharacterized protein LOC129607158 n=1 Tax=Condylostylus longicornis TaxID=2530218 RepID=UPI00244E2693|nr:uncharacterized protein LOC129607158 [Condylostylus longicornis]
MFFQSNKKKKRLWRARVKQPATTLIQLAASAQQNLVVTTIPVSLTTITTTTTTTSATTTSIPKILSGTISNNLIMSTHYSNYQEEEEEQQQQQQQQPKQEQIQQQQYLQMDLMTNTQILDETSSTCPMICQQQSSMNTINNLMKCSGDRSDTSSMIDGQENSISGYYYENSIESTTDQEEDQTMSITASPISTPSITTTSSLVNLVRKSASKRRLIATPIQNTVGYTQMIRQKSSTKDILTYHQSLRGTNPTKSSTIQSVNTGTSTVCDWVKNCCGGGNNFSTDSINSSQLYNNNNTNSNNFNKLSTYTPILSRKNLDTKIQEQIQQDTTDEQLKQLFQALLGKVKEPQLTTLVQAVDSLQKNSSIYCTSNCSNTGILSTTPSDSLGHQPDCVLVPRALIMGIEPNVIACRIWRWPDIRSSKELKSIASCCNEKDPIYACCNPTHWSRLLVPETPPPPYQLHTTERLKPEDHALNQNTKDREKRTNDSITDQKRDLRIQFSGSLTTENEDTSIISSSWCKVAYWEIKQRVGGLFPVENSSVNIFFDQYRGDGMCLKTLVEQRKTATPQQVLKVRQKIGLGVTLSQESDGVWLYNRSSSPVFVHSPTLNPSDYFFHVTKVPPDYCLKAYDNFKAKTQNIKWPSQIAGAQTGPIDRFSMRISFAKGWGPNYTRQDVTACPCWLEVLLCR